MPGTGRLGSIANRLAAATRILVIEDEQDLAGFLGAWFRASGYDLTHCDPPSIEGLIAAVDEQQPDCILLDVGLRGFSGLDAYERLRSQRRYDHTPIIVVSADVTVKTQLKNMTSQLDDFVAKPFSVNALGEIVKERIELARLDSMAQPASESGALARRTHDELQELLESAMGDLDDDLTALTLVSVALSKPKSVEREVGARGIDFVLRHVASSLSAALGTDVSSARSVENDLILVAPGVDAAAVHDAIRERVDDISSTPITMPGGASVSVAICAGMACYPDNAATPDELFMACDAALADARDQKRSLVVAL